jgi:hypothetical protein
VLPLATWEVIYRCFESARDESDHRETQRGSMV